MNFFSHISKITVCATLALAAGFMLSAQHFTPLQKLQFSERVINQFYVDTVNEPHLVEEGIKAMLKTLDPHSSYTTPEETRELTEPLQGNFSGIGVQFNMGTDTVYVIQTVSGGPCEKVGMLAGDRIIAANDTVLAGRKLRNSEVMKHLRGPKGSEVKLTVLRRGVAEPLTFNVVRDDIPVYSVDAYYMAAPEIGYIRVSRFAETTPREMAKAYGELRRKGMKHLILDLEDNGGGYLNAATDMAEMFLNKDDLIVYTKGNAMPSQFYRSESKPVMDKGRLVIMVNQGSASASEIVSGAVQDQDRGLIVGRRTFGKGLVQRPFPMPDGSMIRLTTARYYTPSGRCIQKPYTVGDNEAYERDLLDRYNNGELTNVDSIHATGKKFYTVRNRRPVYEGGGITPDLFVPIDTTWYSPLYRDILGRGILNRYVTSYVDINRANLKRHFKKPDSFVRDFKVTDGMIDEILDMARADSISVDSAQLARSRETLVAVMKGLIGRDIYESDVYYEITNHLNPVYRRALQLIADERRYGELLSPASE